MEDRRSDVRIFEVVTGWLPNPESEEEEKTIKNVFTQTTAELRN